MLQRTVVALVAVCLVGLSVLPCGECVALHKVSHAVSSAIAATEGECVPVDHNVEGVPPELKCLNEWRQNATHLCDSKHLVKDKVMQALFDSATSKCVLKPKVPLNLGVVLCVPFSAGTPEAKTLRPKDQPEPFVNSVQTQNPVKRTQMLRNAADAINRRMVYSQCQGDKWPHERDRGFRLDCVGLIARAWNLAPMAAFTTKDLERVSKSIDCKDLLPGDILKNKPHVQLFVSWVDKAATSATVWEAAGTALGHRESKVEKLPNVGASADSLYSCWRYKNVID